MASYGKRVISELNVHEIVDYLLDQYDSNEVSRAIAKWFVPEESYIQKSKTSEQTTLKFSKQTVVKETSQYDELSELDGDDDTKVIVVAKKNIKPPKPVSKLKKPEKKVNVPKQVKSEKVDIEKNVNVPEKAKAEKTKSTPKSKVKTQKQISSQDDEEPQINVNVGRLKKNKQASIDSKFRTKRLKFKAECSTCTGYLASGKPCIKPKIVEYGMCTRCCGELKEKGHVHFDEDLGYFYRDVKFTVDDPNGMFFKGQEVRQYSQYSRTFDFNGAQCHRRYYVFTRKDVLDDFKSCTFITTSCPFFKNTTLDYTNIERYRLESKPEPEDMPEETDAEVEDECREVKDNEKEGIDTKSVFGSIDSSDNDNDTEDIDFSDDFDDDFDDDGKN